MVQFHLLLTNIGTWYNVTRHFPCNEGGIFNDIPSRSKEAMIQKLLDKEIARNWRAFYRLAKANQEGCPEGQGEANEEGCQQKQETAAEKKEIYYKTV